MASQLAHQFTGISEYDVMGAIRGEPVDLVDCETVPLKVPASAEIVIEGWISTDPSTFTEEGPYANLPAFMRPNDRKTYNTCNRHFTS